MLNGSTASLAYTLLQLCKSAPKRTAQVLRSLGDPVARPEPDLDLDRR